MSCALNAMEEDEDQTTRTMFGIEEICVHFQTLYRIRHRANKMLIMLCAVSLWNVLSLLGKCVSIDDAAAAHVTQSVPVSSWQRVASSRTREASSTRHRADRGSQRTPRDCAAALCRAHCSVRVSRPREVTVSSGTCAAAPT